MSYMQGLPKCPITFYIGHWELTIYMRDDEFDNILDQVTCMKNTGELEEMLNGKS